MKFKTLALALMTTSLLVACDDDNDKEESQTTKPDENIETKKDSTSQNTSTAKNTISVDKIKTTPEEAIKKARDVYQGQKLKDISFEQSNGEWVYKITQQSSSEESEVIISSKNKEILNKHVEKEISVISNSTFEYKEAIDYKKAIEKAKKEFDGALVEWSLEKDDGSLVYNIQLDQNSKRHEVTIDAKNGNILKKEQDNNESDDDSNDSSD